MRAIDPERICSFDRYVILEVGSESEPNRLLHTNIHIVLDRTYEGNEAWYREIRANLRSIAPNLRLNSQFS